MFGESLWRWVIDNWLPIYFVAALIEYWLVCHGYSWIDAYEEARGRPHE